tara:strand:- start:2613 stop:2765 length:153 start_codon:yes stop_codon:yes gene_type:complete
MIKNNIWYDKTNSPWKVLIFYYPLDDIKLTEDVITEEEYLRIEKDLFWFL